MRHALGLPALALQQAVLEALAVVLEIAAKKVGSVCSSQVHMTAYMPGKWKK